MIPYWILFFIPAWQAIKSPRSLAYRNTRWSVYWRWMFVGLIFMIGLRHEVGGDWFTYMGYIYYAASYDFIAVVERVDPAYGVLNWIGSRTGWGGGFGKYRLCCDFFVGVNHLFKKATKAMACHDCCRSVSGYRCRYGVYTAGRCNRDGHACFGGPF